MKKLVFLPALVCSLMLVLSGCQGSGNGTDENRVGTDRISFVLPEGLAENTDFQSTDGWEKLYTDNVDNPGIIIRVSSNLGLTDSADSTVAGLRAEAMFNGAYGENFVSESVEKFETDNADVGVKASFSATDANTGKDMTGYWFLVSKNGDDQVAAVELLGMGVTEEMATQVGNSIEFTP